MFKRKNEKKVAATESAPPKKNGKIAKAVSPNKKKKKSVQEIDGVLWLLDANGNPFKKVRKKGGPKDPEVMATATPSKPTAARTPLSGVNGTSTAAATPDPNNNSRKPKKNVAEIDGQLYLLDGQGIPTKKLRKKGEKIIRRKSMGGQMSEGRGRSPAAETVDQRRSHSLGRGITAAMSAAAHGDQPSGELRRQTSKIQRKDYVDDRGRRVIIEEDGSKTVIDKNGKRLRSKKKKVAPAPPPPSDDDSVFLGGNGLNDNFLDAMPQMSMGEAGMFDKLWDDGASARAGARASAPLSPTKGLSSANQRTNNGMRNGMLESAAIGDDETNQTGDESRQSLSLSAKISEFGKENRELSLKLLTAEEEIQELSEQNKKEKAKNIKALTDMMQLKADYTETSSEIQKLRSRIKDLSSTVDGKDQQIEALIEKVFNAEAAAMQAPEAPPKMMGQWHSLSGPKDDLHRGHGVEEGAPTCPSCGAGNKEVEELYAENRALQRKLEFEKTSGQQDLKKKEDKIAFMQKELTSIREEMEMILRGEMGDTAVNPTFVRLLDARKELEAKLAQEKEVSSIRIESMQDTIESLEMINRDLKKQFGKEHGEEDHSIDFVTGLPRSPMNKSGGGKSKGKTKDKKKSKDKEKHVGEIQVNFDKKFQASNHASSSKGWFFGQN